MAYIFVLARRGVFELGPHSGRTSSAIDSPAHLHLDFDGSICLGCHSSHSNGDGIRKRGPKPHWFTFMGALNYLVPLIMSVPILGTYLLESGNSEDSSRHVLVWTQPLIGLAAMGEGLSARWFGHSIPAPLWWALASICVLSPTLLIVGAIHRLSEQSLFSNEPLKALLNQVLDRTFRMPLVVAAGERRKYYDPDNYFYLNTRVITAKRGQPFPSADNAVVHAMRAWT